MRSLTSISGGNTMRISVRVSARPIGVPARPMRSKIGLLVLLLAYVLLVPGLTQPMLSLTGTVDKAEMMELGKETILSNENLNNMIKSMAAGLIDRMDVQGEVPAYQKTRSILGTVQELFNAHQYFVGFAIMMFSVIIPVLKGILVIMVHLRREGRLRSMGINVSNLISKWSMADVFLVAIIVAYMATNATQHTEQLFSLTAEFGTGFYYFLAYCLLSILSVQLMPSEP
ncbi:MAG TPA: paraquat-inducible protein A [Chromatiaceae bacterium]|jgi:hypothetical protein|nr:paraquat-inducible protein A [Chromatiaceae bacterium]HIB85194.1 paraquat-inducible protein A [Chromatiaceae bacterium]HIO54496.1 paraquat-inducible protein A [Chromatiales bacterium]